MSSSTIHYRPPDPLKVTGSNIADNWHRFKEQWDNYEIATDLTEASTEKRAAVFLTCVGTEAYDVYRAMEFTSADDRSSRSKQLSKNSASVL